MEEIGANGEYRFELLSMSDFIPDIQLATIIIASIVEEETNNNAEKPLIASVYLNRLQRGMPLQADPTVKYAVGDFTLRRILNKHLAADSPFNTYLHTGLPPAPICLPSKATIDAVINGEDTEPTISTSAPATKWTAPTASPPPSPSTNATPPPSTAPSTNVGSNSHILPPFLYPSYILLI